MYESVSGADPVSESARDRRLDAPAFHRNHAALLDFLTPYLAHRHTHALEIGSGSGQHAVAFAQAFPWLTWWPSDPEAVHRASIDAWGALQAATNLAPALTIDTAAPDWVAGALSKSQPEAFAAILCINVLHVASWTAAEGLVAGAAQALEQTGRLFIYGPFTRDGGHVTPTNEELDLALRLCEPQWGLRDTHRLGLLAAHHGLVLESVSEMPVGNLMLVFGRR